MRTFIIMPTFIVALSVLISGCSLTDADWEKIGNTVAREDDFHMGGYFGPMPYSPTVWMDSVSLVNDSTYTFWGHYQFDSVLVILKGELNYWQQTTPMPPNPVTISKRYLSEPDTIDFRTLTDSIASVRKEWIYRFSVTMDSLESNAYYYFCLSGQCLYKNEVRGLGTCNYFVTK